jgi:hypothetical protein
VPTKTPIPATDTPAEINPAWLITDKDLNEFANEIGISNWELGEEQQGNFRICRNFFGTSLSANPNLASNCINRDIPPTFEELIAFLYEIDVLYPTDINLEPVLSYDHDFALYTFQADNGHSVYMAFLMSDDLLFRATVSVGTGVGSTPETIFDEHGVIIETFLKNILMINLERRSNGGDVFGEADVYGEAMVSVGPCKFVELGPVEGAEKPTYTFKAVGFLANESLIISLTDPDPAIELSQIILGASDDDGALEFVVEWRAEGSTPVTLELGILSQHCNIKQALPSIAQDNVLFTTNIGAEIIGYTLLFQHPRYLEVGYFSDSGAYGWLISDTNPNEAFWNSNQTGDEIVILMMLAQIENKSSEFEAQFQENVPAGAPIEEISEGDKQGAYYVNAGETRGFVITQEIIFTIYGRFPPEKEDTARSIVETVLSSSAFPNTDGQDINFAIWGTRFEGPLEKGEINDGYLPVSSESSWEFNQDNGNIVDIAINTGVEESVLLIDILDQQGISVLPSGQIEVSGTLENIPINLPGKGTYTLQLRVHPSSPWYGWYQIQLDAAPAGAAAGPSITRAASPKHTPTTSNPPPTSAVYSVAWSPDGLLASGSDDGTVTVWNPESGELVHNFKEHCLVNSVAWSADGRLAVAGIDGSANVWASDLEDVVQTLNKFPGYIKSVGWSADGRLASDGVSNIVMMWDLDQGEPEQILGLRLRPIKQENEG